MSLVYILPRCFLLGYITILSFRLYPYVKNNVFPAGFPSNILNAFPFAVHVVQAYISSVDLITEVVFDEEHKLYRLQLSPVFCSSLLYRDQLLILFTPQTLVSKTILHKASIYEP
jgi:hypothetical protein